jgi:hypothetical protein
MKARMHRKARANRDQAGLGEHPRESPISTPASDASHEILIPSFREFWGSGTPNKRRLKRKAHLVAPFCTSFEGKIIDVHSQNRNPPKSLTLSLRDRDAYKN